MTKQNNLLVGSGGEGGWRNRHLLCLRWSRTACENYLLSFNVFQNFESTVLFLFLYSGTRLMSECQGRQLHQTYVDITRLDASLEKCTNQGELVLGIHQEEVENSSQTWRSVSCLSNVPKPGWQGWSKTAAKLCERVWSAEQCYHVDQS